MDPEGPRELEAAGVVDSKFGRVTLLRPSGDGGSCLGFLKHVDDPNLQISGWSCQGEALPARRAAIGCMLNRLILLTAGNDPKLAELFARAELRRTNCGDLRAGLVVGLGDIGGQPALARHALIDRPPSRWFSSNFSYGPALFRRSVAGLTLWLCGAGS